MTEGDRICPYCIQPMEYVGYGNVDKTQVYHCKPCNIDVGIKELARD